MSKIDQNPPGIMLYYDVLDPIIQTCKPEEVGLLIMALFANENDEHGVYPVQDRMLQLAYTTLKSASNRDKEAYTRKCCNNAVIALYRNWRNLKKAEGKTNLDKDVFFGETLDEINAIRKRYNYYGELPFMT